MRVWKIADEKKCYFCQAVENEDNSSHGWEVKSTGDLPDDNWEKTIKTPIKLVEIIRNFSKEDQVKYCVCSRCMLLLLLDEDRSSFRYGFRFSKEAVLEKAPKGEKVAGKEEESGSQKSEEVKESGKKDGEEKE